MPDRYNRLILRARRVLQFSQEEAESMRQRSIGTEHILIALLREEGGVAFEALKSYGLSDVARLRELCTAFTKIPIISPNEQLDLNNEVKKMLEFSVDASRKIGNNFIGTEHMLLGIVCNEKFTASRMLSHLGVTSEQIRHAVYGIILKNPVDPNQVVKITATPALEANYPSEVQKIIEIARSTAKEQQSKELEPEHLLLGLLETNDSDTSIFLHELGIEDMVSTVRSAAVSAPKRQDSVADTLLHYSHPTETALSDALRFPSAIAQITPKNLLMGLTRRSWVLIRLWSLLNIDDYALRTALARAGLAAPPPPRFSWRAELQKLLFFDFVGLFNRLFLRK